MRQSKPMTRRDLLRRAPALAAVLAVAALDRRAGTPSRGEWTGLGTARPAAAQDREGVPAPPAVVQELKLTLARALERFQAKDLPGVLAYVSDQYWTGPFTKASLRVQLQAIFGVHEEVRGRVRIDDVRMVGERAWVYSTGALTGRLALVGQWVPLFTWEHELEVARREPGGWRLYGYQA
jgi:hypothetical protein